MDAQSGIRESRNNTQGKQGINSSVLFSTPYSVKYNQISHILSKYLPAIYTDPALYQVLNEGFRLIARRAPTLVNIFSPSLVHTAI